MKAIIKKLNGLGYKVDYKKNDYINIARKDGMHCEFYFCGPNDEMLTATYNINGKETEINIDTNLDIDLFIRYVGNILAD